MTLDSNKKEDGDSSENYGRPLSIEDYSNRFFVHPLSSLVVKLALPLRMSANLVSLMGLGAGLLAGFFYFQQDQKVFVLAGFLSMVVWHILDGADGRIARATGTASAFGRIIDGICDHLVFGSVYFAFVFYILKNGGSNMVWVFAILSVLSHALQAAGYEERRQKFQRRTRGQDRDTVSSKLLHVDGKKSFLAGIYDTFQRLSTPENSQFDDTLNQLRRDSVGPDNVQALVNKTVPIVRAWALLNANNRTIVLAVMALIGHPIYYFFYEFGFLNIVFISLLYFERGQEKRIVENYREANQV